MSVRRLAAEQPDSFEFTPRLEAVAQALIAKYPEGRQASAVVPLLWETQKEAGGWLPEPALRAVADRLGMAPIRVLEVATFYTMFMLEPVGSVALVQVCGVASCQQMGAAGLFEVCKKVIGPRDHVSADGKFYWQEVECMGACANAPMAAINDYYYEDLTPEALEQLLADFAAGKSPPPGSAAGRQGSSPAGGFTSLTDPSLYDGSRAEKITIPNLAPAAEPA